MDELTMGCTLLLAALMGGLAAPNDTVVELRRGDRVVIENLSGEVFVRGWDQTRLELREEDQEATLVVVRSGSVVRVEADDRKRRSRSVEAVVRLPSWVDVEIRGRSLEVGVSGLEGAVTVMNVEGDVTISDVGGPVEVRSIEGKIEVLDARDGVSASSQAEDVRLERVRGWVEVHSGSGDLTLVDIRAESVRAETQDGDVQFSGTISEAGSYGFFVHDGDARVSIPEDTSARVSVSTFDGDFESEFPVRVTRFTSGREFDFALGDGAARLEIQVFDGEIRLLTQR